MHILALVVRCWLQPTHPSPSAAARLCPVWLRQPDWISQHERHPIGYLLAVSWSLRPWHMRASEQCELVAVGCMAVLQISLDFMLSVIGPANLMCSLSLECNHVVMNVWKATYRVMD